MSRFLKNYILVVIVAIVLFFAIGGFSKVFAISYNHDSSSFDYPDVYDISGNLVGTMTVPSTLDSIYYHTLGAIDGIFTQYDKSSSFMFYPSGPNSYYSWTSFSSSSPYTCGSLATYESGSEVYLEIFDANLVRKGIFFMYDFSGKTSTGAVPTDFAHNGVFNVLTVASGSNVGAYLYSFDYFVYNTSSGAIYHEKKVFHDGTYFGTISTYGFKLSNQMNCTWLPSASATNYRYNSFGIDWQGVYNVDSSDPGSGSVARTTFVKDFLESYTVSSGSVQNPAGYFFGSDSYFSSESGPGVGTDEIFANCGSFLDVGCYIQGIYNAFVAWIESLFPTLSFNTLNTCASGTTSTGGTFMGRMANFIALVNPIPPSEGTNACTLFMGLSIEGTGYVLSGNVLDYQMLWPEENFFEVYLHGQVDPRLEMDMRNVVYGQSPIDLIVIVSILGVIFYQYRKEHD